MSVPTAVFCLLFSRFRKSLKLVVFDGKFNDRK
jgi:hypothetical protein